VDYNWSAVFGLKMGLSGFRTPLVFGLKMGVVLCGEFWAPLILG